MYFVMEVMIPLSSLLYVLLALVGAVALVALAVLLFQLVGVASRLKKSLDDISPDVTKTVKTLPGVMEKVDGVLDDVQTVTDSAKESIPEILHDASGITGAVETTVGSIGDAASGIADRISRRKAQEKKDEECSFDLAQVARIAGQVVALIGVLRDLKQEHEAKEAEREKEARARERRKKKEETSEKA
ncbi:MAG: hypothetical protein GX924_03870 [Clostridiaceae bacterium]|nr:hypothetical protein [Clostridiaceae bacterium]